MEQAWIGNQSLREGSVYQGDLVSEVRRAQRPCDPRRWTFLSDVVRSQGRFPEPFLSYPFVIDELHMEQLRSYPTKRGMHKYGLFHMNNLNYGSSWTSVKFKEEDLSN